jgi:hypothetical protein
VTIVKIYKESFDSNIVIIHSTVSVGTTKKCGDDFVHSPIRGKHLNLEEGIKTFTKFFSGDKGMDIITTLNSNNTEAIKLWDTEIHREAILRIEFVPSTV